MSKLITPPMSGALNTQFGSDPVIVVGISWGGVPTYYATKSVFDSGIYCKGVIKSVGQINISRRSDNMGSTGSVDLEIYDTDGEFKLVIDQTKMEGTKATVFQHFSGLRSSDWLPLLYGRICNPKWTEGNRVFSCTVEALVISDEVGYAPVPEDFSDLSPEAYGVPWPVLFGDIEMSPCVHVRKKVEGTLKTNIQLDSDVYKVSENTISWVPPEEIDVISYFEGTTKTTNIIYIKDGSKFPQGIEVKIDIDGVIFKGSFSGDNFTCTAANVPRYENVPFDSRVIADPDEEGYTVAWLKEQDGVIPNLAGCHIFFSGPKDWYNFIVKQENTKVWFKYPTFNPNTRQPVKIAASHSIKSAFTIEPSGVVIEISEKIFRIKQLQEYRKATLTPQPSKPVFGLLIQTLDNLIKKGNIFWSANAGTRVRLFSQDDPDIYLISLNTVSQIYAVYGKKKTKLGTHEQVSFVPIPASYYQEQLESNYAISGQRASALLFYKSLSEYNTDLEKWEDTVYVSCQSSIGPNTSDIIRWLLLNFTDYSINEKQFNTVAGQLTYPSNFGLYDRKDTLEVCREIAWQARCGLVSESTQVGIKYLAAEPSAIVIWDESNVQYKSLEFFTTENTQVVTRLIGTWRESNEFSEPPTRLINQNRATEIRDVLRAINEVQRREQPVTNIVLHEENIDRYGVKAQTVDVYIYDFEEPVQACIDFWGHRMANVWRKVQFKTALYGLIYEIWDAIDIALDIFGTVKCLIDEIRYDTVEKDIGITMWTPIIEGTQVQDSEAWNG